MADFAQTLMTALAVGSLYALIALGYTMVYGILKFINFAHSDIVVLGAWISFTIAKYLLPALGLDPHNGAVAPPIWVGASILIASMVACGLIGFTIERLAYRPLRKAPRLNVLITAIGVSLLLQNVGQLNFVFGPSPERMPALLPNWELLRLSLPSGDGHRDVVVGLVDTMIIGTSAALMMALQYLVFRTKLGTAMRAVSFDFDAAALMGIPVDRVVSFTFVLGSALAAAAGFLYCAQIPRVESAGACDLGAAGFEGVCRGGYRRDWQRPRGRVGRFRHRVRRAVWGVLSFVELSRCVRLRAAHRHFARSAFRAARLHRAGKGVAVTNTSLANAPLESARPPRERGRLGTIANSAWPLVAGVAIAAVMHFALPKAVGPFYTRIVIDMGIAIILAVSLNIVNGMTGQFSLGHAAFLALGGYAAGMVTMYGSMLLWDWDTPARYGGFLGSGEWLFVAACFVGGCVATAAGYVVGLPSLRLRGDYLAIVTLGFGEILRVVLQQTGPVIDNTAALRNAGASQFFPPPFGSGPPVGGALGFNGLPKYTNLFWVYAFVTLMLVVAFRLKRSSLGRAMIAVREDEFAAQAMGVNVARIKVRAFMMAAFFAGIAGGLYAHEKGNIISPDAAGFQGSFNYVLMTVLGGRGSITGVMLAAIILTALPEVLRDFDQYRLIVYALLLIGMMLLRPQGLFGIHEIWDFWPRRKSKEPGAGSMEQEGGRSDV